MTQPNVVYEERMRMAKYVVIAVCALLVGVQHAWFPDAAASLLTNALTMFVLGPVLLLMDFSSCTPAKRWQHYLETAARVCLLLWLVYCMPSGILAFLTMGFVFILTLMLCHGVTAVMKYTPYTLSWSQHDVVFAAFVGVVLTGTLDILISSWEGPSGVGLWLMAGCMVLSIIDWHDSMWNGICRKMSPSQHTQVWPALFKTTTVPVFLDHLQWYIEKYPSDARVCLDALSLKTLLTFFSLFQPNAHLREQVKMAINEKEPRAQYVWHLYDDHHAAAYIKKTLFQDTDSASCDTLELPAL